MQQSVVIVAIWWVPNVMSLAMFYFYLFLMIMFYFLVLINLPKLICTVYQIKLKQGIPLTVSRAYWFLMKALILLICKENQLFYSLVLVTSSLILWEYIYIYIGVVLTGTVRCHIFLAFCLLFCSFLSFLTNF